MSKKLLGHPLCDKHSSYKENKLFRVASCAMQGWRRNMEDTHICQFIPSTPEQGELGVFAVFDGHGGDTTSAYCRDNFVENLLETRKSQPISEWPDVLVNTFITLDNRCCTTSATRYEGSGSTAISVVVADGVVYVANAGDCRCVLGTRGPDGDLTTVVMSTDHKPSNPSEKARIEREGGAVSDGRINGLLGVSRAVGDFDFKACVKAGMTGDIVTVMPDVTTRVIGAEDEFIFIASDGIWECVEESDEVVQQLDGLTPTSDLMLVLEQLLVSYTGALPKTPGVDNMTAILVQIKK